MATNFPGGYDTPVNPTASPPGSDRLNTPTVLHSSQHTNLNDAVVAIEHAFGLSGTSSGVNYSLNQLSGAVTTISGQITTINTILSGSSSGAPVSGTYLTLSALSGTAARTFTLGAGLTGTDAGSGSTYTVKIATSTVTTGTYANATVTVDAQGRVQSASAGASGITGVDFWPGGGPLARMHLGSVIGLGDMYYDARANNSSGNIPLTGFSGVMVGGSIVAARTCTFNKMMVRITTGVAAGRARIAVYEETSSSDFRPSALVVQSTEIVCTGAVNYTETLTGSYTMTSGKRYWLFYHCNSNTIAVYSATPDVVDQPFGCKGAVGAEISRFSVLQGTQVYGAFPSTMPTLSGVVQTGVPLVGIAANS